MRHQVRGRKLGRTSSHRKATLQALCVALIREHRIQTTLAKAKELRRHIEPLITRAKEDTMHNRRLVFSTLQNKLAVKALFEEVAPQVGQRPGGYTRVLKTGFRSGDAAEMALIELVDFNLGGEEVKETKSDTKQKGTRRSGRKATARAAAATETSNAGEASSTTEEQVETAQEVQEPQKEASSEDANAGAEQTGEEKK